MCPVKLTFLAGLLAAVGLAETLNITHFSATTVTTFPLADGPHIAYIDSNKHVSQVWFTGNWNYNDITSLSQATQAADSSALSSFVLSDGVHLVYADVNQHLSQVFYPPSAARWFYNDLTSLSNSPTMTRGDIGNFIHTDGPHIVYIDNRRHIGQVWYTASTNTWNYNDISALTGAPPASRGSALTNFFFSDGPHTIYSDQNQHLGQVWYSVPSGRWFYNDLTATANGSPKPAIGTGLTTVELADGSHTFYVDENRHMTQLWYDKAASRWRYEDLTPLCGCSLATLGSALTSFIMPDGPHVVYLDVNSHVVQFWYNLETHQWLFNDLTVYAAGSPNADPNASLASFGVGGVPHIVYVDAKQNLSQLWYESANNSWRYENLTTIIGSPTANIPTQPSLRSIAPAREFVYFNGAAIATENRNY